MRLSPLHAVFAQPYSVFLRPQARFLFAASEEAIADQDAVSGHCSREQPYRPRDCARCGADVTQKAGGGFWEGGKGTRDPVRMSRKGELLRKA